MRNKSALVLVTCLTMLLAACGSEPAAAPTPAATLAPALTLVPTEPAPAVVPTDVPTSTPTPNVPASVGPHAGWTTCSNPNEVTDIAFSGPLLWMATTGGAVLFDPADSTYKTYTTADGLPTNDLLCVAVAPDGTPWFGGRGAVLSFDGQGWRSYDPGFYMAANIAVAPDGTVWVVGDGAAHWDGQSWTLYGAEEGLAAEQGLVNDVAFAPDGAVWVGTPTGVARLDGQRWIAYDMPEDEATTSVGALAVGPDGTVWTASYQGLSHFDGETWTTFENEAEVAAFPAGMDVPCPINAVVVAPDGKIWTGGSSDVGVYDGTSWTNYANQNSMLVSAVAIAPDGAIWFGTEESGIGRVEEGGYSTFFASELPQNDTTSVAIAPDGAAWLTPFFAPSVWAVRFDGESWKNYGEEDGLPYEAGNTLVLAPDGLPWIVGQGVYRFDGQRWIDMGAPISGASITGIAFAPDGTAWISSYKGAARLQGQMWTTFLAADGLAGDSLTAVAVAADGTAWLGTDENGLSRFDGTGWTTLTGADGLPGDDISALAVAPDGSLWVGTPYDGLARFDGGAWVVFPDVLNIEMIAPAPNGAIWVATSYGAWFFDGTNWTTYTAADGLASDQVQGISVAPDGAVWFATENGVSKYRP